MDDKGKFLQEWKEKFPSEEPPDTSFLGSIERVREKIQASENKIEELELSIKKEEFLLSWLVTLEIELSVLGNVGTGHDFGDINQTANESNRPIPQPRTFNSRDENSTNPQEGPSVIEYQLSAASPIQVDDNDSNLTLSNTNEKPNLDPTSCQDLQRQPADMKSEREKCFETLTGGRDQIRHGNESVSGSPEITHKKLSRTLPTSQDSSVPVPKARLRSRSEAFLDSVFEVQNKQDDQEIVLRDRRHSSQSNRRGGSWSTYIENESLGFSMNLLNDEPHGGKIGNALDLSKIGTTSDNALSPKHKKDNQLTSEHSTQDPPENYKNLQGIHFSQEVSTFSQEMEQLTGKVVEEMNGTQKVTAPTEPPSTGIDIVRQEEIEDDEDESIYENLLGRDYHPLNEEDDDEDNIYENIQDIHFGLHSRYLTPTLATGSDSNSEYDSDPSHDFEENLSQSVPPPNFRRMTLDEIEKLSRWKSDEDLSQSSHELDDKSGDSDDSLGRKRAYQRFGSDASDSVDFAKKNTQNREDRLVRDTLNRLKPGDSVQDHLADSSEENEDLLENKTQRMRKYLVFNLLDSERCYYDCLDMVKKYMKPLQKSLETSQPVLTKPDFEKIFRGIDGLYELHKNFMEQLEPRIESWSDKQVIGDILSVLMDGFNLYKEYVNNYKESMETLLKCRNANSTFDEIIKKDIKITSLKEPIKFDVKEYGKSYINVKPRLVRYLLRNRLHKTKNNPMLNMTPENRTKLQN